MAYDEFLPIDRQRMRHRRYRLIGVVAAGCLVIGVCAIWLVHRWSQNANDPFSSSMRSSVNFPLYYPTVLPSGYTVGANAVNKPQPNVVILTLTNRSGQRLYISEESPPQNFNVENYTKEFAIAKRATVDGNQVAAGVIDSTKKITVGSWLSGSTWILANTDASSGVQPSQLLATLESLKLSQ